MVAVAMVAVAMVTVAMVAVALVVVAMVAVATVAAIVVAVVAVVVVAAAVLPVIVVAVAVVAVAVSRVCKSSLAGLVVCVEVLSDPTVLVPTDLISEAAVMLDSVPNAVSTLTLSILPLVALHMSDFVEVVIIALLTGAGALYSVVVSSDITLTLAVALVLDIVVTFGTLMRSSTITVSCILVATVVLGTVAVEHAVVTFGTVDITGPEAQLVAVDVVSPSNVDAWRGCVVVVDTVEVVVESVNSEVVLYIS